MQLKKCDKCGAIKENANGCCIPAGWREISYHIGSYQTKRYDLCPDCQVKIGIPDAHSEEANQNIADRLLDIIAEIAQEAVRQ